MPGELLGYWEAHQKYGKLQWSDLFEPTISLCATGSRVTKYLASYLISKEPLIRMQKSLAEILINPITNSTWKVNMFLFVAYYFFPYFSIESLVTVKFPFFQVDDRIKRPRLAETLKLIARHGPGIFYNGTMADTLVEEIKAFNGIIKKEDLQNYRFV